MPDFVLCLKIILLSAIKLQAKCHLIEEYILLRYDIWHVVDFQNNIAEFVGKNVYFAWL